MNNTTTPRTQLTSNTLRAALGPGFQLAGATERLLREATRRC